MKNLKSTIALTGLVVGLAAFTLQTPQAAVPGATPITSQSFNAHHAETDITLGLGQSVAIPLPVVNRVVRLSIVMASNQDGEIDFEDVTTLYSINPGFEGVIRIRGFTGNNLFDLSAGTNQSIIITAAEDKSGPVHVTMWY
jgi:hypothetical protein